MPDTPTPEELARLANELRLSFIMEKWGKWRNHSVLLGQISDALSRLSQAEQELSEATCLRDEHWKTAQEIAIDRDLYKERAEKAEQERDASDAVIAADHDEGDVTDRDGAIHAAIERHKRSRQQQRGT